MTLTHADADDYMREFLYSETSATYKSNTQKALKRDFNWIADEKDGKPWERKRSVSTSSGNDDPRKFLILKERTKIREAASPSTVRYRRTVASLSKNALDGRRISLSDSANRSRK